MASYYSSSGYSFKSKKKKKLSAYAALLILLALGFIAAASIGFLGKSYWLADLFSHFPLQYLLFGVPLAFLLLLKARWKLALAVLAVTLVQFYPLREAWNFAELTSDEQPNEASAKVPGEITDSLRVLQHNLYPRNEKKQELVNSILEQKEQLDVVVLQEVSPEWLPYLEELKSAFLYHDIAVKKGSVGHAVFSRVPTTDIQKVEVEEGQSVGVLKAYTREKLIPFTVYLLQPPPPLSAQAWRTRNAVLEKTIELIKANESENILLVGDLNVTPYSRWFGLLEKETGLKYQRQNAAELGTWPHYLPSYLRLPIDVKLVSDAVQVEKRELGDNMGSDHLPVLTSFVLKTGIEDKKEGVAAMKPSAAQKKLGLASLPKSPDSRQIPSRKTPPTEVMPVALPQEALEPVGEGLIAPAAGPAVIPEHEKPEPPSILEEAVKAGLLPPDYLEDEALKERMRESDWTPLEIKQNRQRYLDSLQGMPAEAKRIPVGNAITP